MPEPAGHSVESDLLDLSTMSLSELRVADLDEAKPAVLQQIEKPRANLGGSGPPGRAD